MPVGIGATGRAAWPPHKNTKKTVQWLSSVVIDIGPDYFAVAKIGKDGNPIYKDKKGRSSSWRVDPGRFKPDVPEDVPEFRPPPIGESSVAVETGVDVASLVCRVNLEPDDGVNGDRSPPAAPPRAHARALAKRKRPSASRTAKVGAGKRRVIARRLQSAEDSTANNAARVASAEPPKPEHGEHDSDKVVPDPQRDDGRSSRIVFALPKHVVRSWIGWKPGSDVVVNRKRRLVPFLVVFLVDQVIVRLDWCDGRLYGRQMHNSTDAYPLIESLCFQRKCTTEMRCRADDETIYVLFDRPRPGWVFAGAWTITAESSSLADQVQPQMLSQFAPPSRHDEICNMPKFKLCAQLK